MCEFAESLMIVRADLEGIVILLVIIGSIISKFVGNKKKEADKYPAGRDTSPAERSSADSAAELRRFLSELSGQPEQRSTPPVPPQQTAAQAPERQVADRPYAQYSRQSTEARSVRRKEERRDTAAAAKRESRRRASAAAAAPLTVQRSGTMQQLREQLARAAAKKSKATAHAAAISENADIIQMLQKRRSLRQAFVLREILGPPRALQR